MKNRATEALKSIIFLENFDKKLTLTWKIVPRGIKKYDFSEVDAEISRTIIGERHLKRNIDEKLKLKIDIYMKKRVAVALKPMIFQRWTQNFQEQS